LIIFRWDNKTLIDFNSRAKCITDQFSKYPLKNADINVNGELTRDENLADLVGLKHTYSAYRNHLTKAEFKEKEWPNFENYTSDQMFFISYANILCTSITNDQALSLALTDAHAPANWRINGAVSNMPQFSKAFNCSKKDTLNNEKRCVIW
jgi:predicted metalloendopeptidase